MRNLIIYGGTFDPIHEGHINTAIAIQNHFHFDRFLFLPCKIPLLKNKATATANQRIAMIKLALAKLDKQHFDIDLSEINRDSPSYMVETLTNFRERLGKKVAISLVMGSDTFNQLPQWHAWEKLLTLANLLVIKRAGVDEAERPELVKKLLSEHESKEERAICHQAQGLIYCFDAGSFNFSSSWIRQQLAEGKDISAYLAEPVLQYIKQNSLYINS